MFPSIMVTGHRKQFFTPTESKFARISLLQIANKCRNELGMQEAISGMASGVDLWWAQVAVKLDIPVAAYIPFLQQPNKWEQSDVEKWKQLREYAHRERIIGDHYSVQFLYARNDAMINDSDLAIAVYKLSKKTGGTFSAIAKIRKQQLPLILVDVEEKIITTERME